MYKKKRFRRLTRRKNVFNYIKLYFIISIMLPEKCSTQSLKLSSGIYYIKLESKDFKFNIDEDYIFYLN